MRENAFYSNVENHQNGININFEDQQNNDISFENQQNYDINLRMFNVPHSFSGKKNFMKMM